MQKLGNLLMASFMVFVLVMTSFAAAQEVLPARTISAAVAQVQGVALEKATAVKATAITAEKEIQALGVSKAEAAQITSIVKAPLVTPIAIWEGFIEKSDKSEGQFVRAVLSHSQYGKLLNALNPETIEEIKTIKETEGVEKAKAAQEIKELVKAKLPEVKESIGGVLIIGRGEEHENYRLVAKEITDESASFYVIPMGEVPTVPATFWGKIGEFFTQRAATAEAAETGVAETIVPENFVTIGELTITRTKYASIEIDRGILTLEETKYAGEWEFIALAQNQLPLHEAEPLQMQKAETAEATSA